MRVFLVFLVGLLCFAFTSCPTTDENGDDTPLIDDEGMRKMDPGASEAVEPEEGATEPTDEPVGTVEDGEVAEGDEIADGEEAAEGEEAEEGEDADGEAEEMPDEPGEDEAEPENP